MDKEMQELKRDMEREEAFQKFRRGMMAFCLGAGLVASIASPDWKSLLTAVTVTVVAELILWLEA